MKPSKRARRRKKPPPPAQPVPAVQPVDDQEEIKQRPAQAEAAAATEVARDEEERRNLDWLMGAFSSASLGEVESATREAGGDAYRAAGILAGRGMGAEGGGKSRRRSKKVVAATGMVADVIGKGYGGRAVGGSGSRAGAAEDGRRREVGREMEEFLFGMMGEGCELDADVVRDVLGHCGYDLGKAVDKLLDLSRSTVSHFQKCADDYYMLHGKKFIDGSLEGFAANCTYMEDKLSDRTAGSSSSTSENDFEYQYPAYCNCGVEACRLCTTEERPSLSCINKQELQKKVLFSLFNIPDYSQQEPSHMDWKKVAKKLESFGQGLEFSVSPANDANLYQSKDKRNIYHTFRGEATRHWDAMKSYYQRAAVAYSKGDHAHASYLSEKGRYFNKLAQGADERASREIFEARNRDIQNEITIDLHGQHVKQAMGLLKLHLLIFTYTPSIQLLRVITGSGSHGVGKGKVKQSVLRLADREGIQWSEENAGTILMKIDASKVYSFVETDYDDLD